MCMCIRYQSLGWPQASCMDRWSLHLHLAWPEYYYIVASESGEWCLSHRPLVDVRYMFFVYVEQINVTCAVALIRVQWYLTYPDLDDPENFQLKQCTSACVQRVWQVIFGGMAIVFSVHLLRLENSNNWWSSTALWMLLVIIKWRSCHYFYDKTHWKRREN